MPKTLNELFKDLKDQLQEAGINWADKKQAEAAMEALKAEVNPLYLAINNLGFGAAQAKAADEVTAAKAAQTAAEQAAQRARDELRVAQDKIPDVATVNQQWQQRLEDAEKAHKAREAELEGRNRGSLLQRDQAELENELVKLKVPRAMAKVLARDPELLPKRGDYDPNGSLSVRQAGQQIPMAPASGQTFLGLLAAEVAATVEPTILVSDGDAGAGVNGGGSPGRGDRSAFFQKVADKAKAEQKGETPRVPLEERIKNR